MPTRYLSVFLPLLPTERLRRAGRLFSSMPSAADVPAPGEPSRLVTVGKINGAQRIMATDALAAARGLKPGMALADARALCPTLLVAEADPEADAALLAAIVDWSRRFTPLVAADGPDGAILDIGGVVHLFGGEAKLVEAVKGGLRRQKLTARAAVASTPEAAWALARFSSLRIAPTPLEPGFEHLVATLPAAALRIAPEIVAGLARAGLGRIGDLLMRPRGPIAARFGEDVLARLDGLMGLSTSPITPHFNVPRCVAERRFTDGLAQIEQIEAALLPLCRHLCVTLERRGEGARRIEASFCRVDGAVKHLTLGTSRPTREPEKLLALFREKLAAIGEEGLDTGYGFDVIRLGVTESERLDARQEDVLGGGPEHGAADAMTDLADRLGARLGLKRVLRLTPRDTHIPECAVVALPMGHAGPLEFGPLPQSSHGTRCFDPTDPFLLRGPLEQSTDFQEDSENNPCRPLRLFEHPEPIETIATVPDGPPVRFRWRHVVHEVAAIEGPERIAPEWWTGETDLTRDYFRAEDRDGRRFWLYREGLFGRETDAPRWYMHGLFG